MNLKRFSQLLVAIGAATALAVFPSVASTAFQLSGLDSGGSNVPWVGTSAGGTAWNGVWDSKIYSSRSVTSSLPSGTTVKIEATGTVNVASKWGSGASNFYTLNGYGGRPAYMVAGTSDTSPAVAVTNYCQDPPQGTPTNVEYNFTYTQNDPTNSTFCTNNSLVPNRGTLKITFSKPVTNPVINFAGIGGYDWRWAGTDRNNVSTKQVEKTMRLWSEFTLVSPAGATLTQLQSGDGEFGVSGGVHYKPLGSGSTVSAYCNTSDRYLDNSNVEWETDRGGHSGCGSLRINGTSDVFEFQLDYNSINGGSVTYSGTTVTNRTTDDTFIVSVSLTDDYGSAPASYDTAATYHTVGDLFMGSGVTPDALNALTPTRDAAGDTETSSAFRALPAGAAMPGAVGSSYSVSVPVTASAAGKVCGWVDWNANGTYDTAERQCATFASGTANKTLTWTVPVGFTPTATWMRLRASYDATNVENPVGALNSGEVEDYQLGVALAVDNPTLANTGMSDYSTLIIVSAMVAMAGGATYLASLATAGPRRRTGN